MLASETDPLVLVVDRLVVKESPPAELEADPVELVFSDEEFFTTSVVWVLLLCLVFVIVITPCFEVDSLGFPP